MDACRVVTILEVSQSQVAEGQRILRTAVVVQQEHVHLVDYPVKIFLTAVGMSVLQNVQFNSSQFPDLLGRWGVGAGEGGDSNNNPLPVFPAGAILISSDMVSTL